MEFEGRMHRDEIHLWCHTAADSGEHQCCTLHIPLLAPMCCSPTGHCHTGLTLNHSSHESCG